MSSSYKKNGAEGALVMVNTEFPVYFLCKFVSFLLLYNASAWLFYTSPAFSQSQFIQLLQPLMQGKKKQSKGNLCLFFSL